MLLCHPFGEEKQLADRVLVHFARRLATAGYAALRFDCRGYGDSDGELSNATLTTQLDDTRTAVAVLRARAGVDRIVLLGARFGGTLAALAASGDADMAGLALWSPVVYGRTYVRELLRKRVAMLLAAQDGGATRDEIVAALERDGRVEFDGDALTLAMYQALSAIDLPGRVAPTEAPVLIGTLRTRNGRADGVEALAAVYREAGAPVELLVAGETDWWDVRSMFDGIFPEALYDATLAWLASHWPEAA